MNDTLNSQVVDGRRNAFRADHLREFSKHSYRAAGPVGVAPRAWVQRYRLRDLPVSVTKLPAEKLDRTSVRAICRDPSNDVLLGYICAMAWGGQGAGPGGSRHIVSAWNCKDLLRDTLCELRVKRFMRRDAFELFRRRRVQGLGPAYFTKLLYFFSADHTSYIMDQWTAKSVNLLTGCHIVRMTGDAVSSANQGGNYEAYCREVDALAASLGVMGEQAEEMMMAKGGRQPWPWRAYLREKWPRVMKERRYSAADVRLRHRDIPKDAF